MTGRFSLLLLVVALGLSLSRGSFAAQVAMRVVLVTNHADAAIVPLLKTELETLGFEVKTVDKGPQEVVAMDLARAARKHQALAAFRVIVANGTVELWIADRVTGKVLLRELVHLDEEGRAEETTVVLRAVELLRASLIEIDSDHPPRGEVEPPAELKKVAGIPPRRGAHALRLSVGPVLMSSDYAPFFSLRFDYLARLSESFRLGGGLGSSLSSGEFSTGLGTATAESRFVLLGATYEIEKGFFHTALGLNAGMRWLSLSGEASGDQSEFDHQAFSPLFQGDAQLSVVPLKSLRLFALLGGGLALNSPSISFAGEEVARFWPGYASLMLGLETRVP